MSRAADVLSVGPWTDTELDDRAARTLNRGAEQCFGVAQACALLVGSPELICFVAGYTEGFFNDPQAAATCTLFVHEVGADEYVRLASRPASPESDRVRLPQARAVCLLRRAKGQVHLFLPGGSEQAGTTVVRVLRALVLDRLLTDGSWFAHAACIELNDVGVALIGPRTAGKTTLLLHCVDHLGAAVVGNDKIAIGGDGATSVAIGFPIRIGIRAGSLLALADGALRRYLLDMWEGRFGDVERHRLDDRARIMLSPQEIAALAHTRVQRTCRLRVAVEPRLDASVPAPSLRRVQPPEAGRVWNANRLATGSEVFPEQAPLATPTPTGCGAPPSVPVYRLTHRPGDGRRSAALIQELIDRVAEGA